MGFRGFKRTVAAVAMSTVAVCGPAQAQRCWNQPLVEAAQVKEFDIMLMVSVLRCQSRGLDFSASYNRFVASHREAIRAVGSELLKEFNASVGGKAAYTAYDKLGVVMANKYGNGVEGVECSDFQAMVAEAEASPAGRAELLQIAQRLGVDPSLPAPRCVAEAAAPAGAAVTASIAR